MAKMPKTFKGKSTKLGFGGRAAILKSKGVPSGVIGAIARKKQAAPGMKNYHGKKKSMAAEEKGEPKMSAAANRKEEAAEMKKKKKKPAKKGYQTVMRGSTLASM